MTRTFESLADHWADAETRRPQPAVPHSDGSFFSDGSGYAVDPISARRYELVDRFREALARLETIDPAELEAAADARPSNSATIPHARDIEEAIRVVREGLEDVGGSELDARPLRAWHARIKPLAERFLIWGCGLAGKNIEEFTTAAAKSAGVAVGPVGIALVLYQCGVDLEGVANTIEALAKLIEASKAGQ
jgi:hypothetical protein